MSSLLNRLSYVKSTSTWKAIAQTLGITSYRLNTLRSNPNRATTEEKRLIRNLYQRTAYRSLRDTGFSTTEASRWSWSTPTTVTSQVTQLSDKISILAYGRVLDEYEQEDLRVGSPEFYKDLQDRYDSIREGMQKSPERTEKLYDY